MPTRLSPVVIEEDIGNTEVVVSAIYGSAGQEFTSTYATENVKIRNWRGDYGIEYQVGGGTWRRLERRMDVVLDINLHATTLRLRKAKFAALPIVIDIETDPSDAARIVLSDDEALNTDGRPDGTIWVQRNVGISVKGDGAYGLVTGTGPGGGGGDGTGDLNYRHIQGVPSSLWTVTHGLGKYPSVVALDSAGDQWEGEITYLSVNTLTISFHAAFSGVAHLN